MNKKSLAVMLIVFACAGAYLNSLDVPFIFDENTKIVRNPDIKQLGNIGTKLIYPYNRNNPTIYRNDPSRPLTYLTLTLNYYFGKLGPYGYHVFNVVLHALNSILTFFLVKELILYVFGTDIILLPFFTALFFAVHPINTSAVSYVLGRADLLATLFYILSLLLFIETFKRNKNYYVPALVCFLLAISSKQTAVTLPAIILIFDYMFMCDFKLNDLLKKKYYHLPFWIILAVYMAFRYFYLGGMRDFEGANALWDRYPYLIIQPYVILRYILFLLIPARLSFYHYLDYPVSMFEFKILGSFVIIAVMFALLVFLAKKKNGSAKVILFSALWFFITLSPTSSFFPTTTPMVENRLYLAGICFYILLVLLYFSVFSGSALSSDKPALLLFCIMGVHVLFLGALTVKRNKLYQEPVALWKEVILRYPANPRAYNNLATLYYDRGEYEKAMQIYKQVLTIRPGYPEAHNGLAMVYDVQGEYEEALKEYKKSLEYKPDFIEAHINLGNLYSANGKYGEAMREYARSIEIDPGYDGTYYNLGVMYFKKKDYDRAVEAYRKALEMNPGNEAAKKNLAGILDYEKKYIGGVAEYKKLIKKDPDNAEAHYNLGLLYKDMQELEKALDEFKKAAEIKPGYTDAHNSLGNLYSMGKQYDKAIREYNLVLKLEPNYIMVYNNLGNIYYLLKEYDKALDEYKKILAVNPENVNVHFNLGNLYYARGEYDRALEEFQKTLKINPNVLVACKRLGDYLLL